MIINKYWSLTQLLPASCKATPQSGLYLWGLFWHCRRRLLGGGLWSGMLLSVSTMPSLTASQTCGAMGSLYGRPSLMDPNHTLWVKNRAASYGNVTSWCTPANTVSSAEWHPNPHTPFPGPEGSGYYADVGTQREAGLPWEVSAACLWSPP